MLASRLGLPVGRAIARLRGWRRHLGAAAAFLPVAAPPIALAVGLQYSFLRLGLGGTHAGVLLAHLVPALGYSALFFLGIFAAYDERYEEEARSLGATRRQVLLRVTLPLLRRPLVEAFVLGFLVSWAQVPLTLVVGQGLVTTLSVEVLAYVQAGQDRIAATAAPPPRPPPARGDGARGRGRPAGGGGGVSALRLAALEVGFGYAPGLRPVSLEVAPGERLALVGTLRRGEDRRCSAPSRGSRRPRRGAVHIAGRDVTSLPPERRSAVYLHQSPVLFPHLDVFENVAFPLRVRRVPEAEIRGTGWDACWPPCASPASEGAARRIAERRAAAPRGPRPRHRRPAGGAPPRRAALGARPVAPGGGEAVDRGGAGGVRPRAWCSSPTTSTRPDSSPIGWASCSTAGSPSSPRRRGSSPGPPRWRWRASSGSPTRWRERCGGTASSARVLGPLPLPEGAPGPGPAVAVFRAEALRVVPEEGVRVRVVGARHRAHRSAALVELEGVALEAPADVAVPGAPGTEILLRVDPARVLLFPA